MNVVAITNLFPSEREPYRGLFNLRGFRSLSELCDLRVVVPVAAWRHIGTSGTWLRPHVERHEGLEVTYVPYWSIPRVGTRFHSDAVQYFIEPHIRTLHRQSRIDVLLAAFAFPDLTAVAAIGRELNIPVVGLVVGSDINELATRPPFQRQIKRALFLSQRIVTVSRSLKERLTDLGVPSWKIVVQHNGVDGQLFRVRDQAHVRDELALQVRGKLVCFVGNLVREKGPAVLLQALRSLPSVQAVFIGDGPLRASLRARIVLWGLGHRVHLLGSQAAESVASWMAASDCLCLPSQREGCPNVVLEALACGRPVVASRVGGVPELLSEANGLMVQPGVPDELAAAIDLVTRRRWSPESIRASVSPLHWHDFGLSLHSALRVAAANEYPEAARTTGHSMLEPPTKIAANAE